MEEKRFLFLFFVLIFILTINFAVAEICVNVGNRTATQYCDVSGNYVNLKINGASCLNSYECVRESCHEGKCQDKYVTQNFSLINQIWNWFNGKECIPEEIVCDGTKYVKICGSTGLWEEKNTYEIGKCGYTGRNGEGSSILMIIDSPRNITYSYTQIPLRVYDRNKLARNWGYSLNNRAQISFTPNITITAREGSNSLNVYAKKSESSSAEVSKSVSFNVQITSGGICGDGVCNANENENSCAVDCYVAPPEPTDVCGDGVCGATESSNDCIEDCQPEEPRSYLWLFILLVIILIFAIAFVLFLLYRQIYGNRDGKINANNKNVIEKPKFPPQNPLMRQQFSARNNPPFVQGNSIIKK